MADNRNDDIAIVVHEPAPAKNTEQVSVEKKGKSSRDAWDKADIIAKLLSSVVIAIIGLLINSSIQKSQIASSEANTRAQIEAAKIKAQDDKKLQEGALTAQLVQHLASQGSTQREIAIIALRESVPKSIYDAVLIVLARSDPNVGVRIRAIEKLGESTSKIATKALTKIAGDVEKSPVERKAAEISTQQSAIGQFLSGSNTVILAAAKYANEVKDPPELGHGVFTYYLLKGLGGEADSDGDGVIYSDELSLYLSDRVKLYTKGLQSPFVFSSGQSRLPIEFADRVPSSRKKYYAIVIGISRYEDSSIPPIAAAAKDASDVAELLKKKPNVETFLLVDSQATRSNILNTFSQVRKRIGQDDVLIVYYSGHGTTLEGRSMLVPYDIRQREARNHLISVDEINEATGNTTNRLYLLDTGFCIGGCR